jgi:hypothetical protein
MIGIEEAKTRCKVLEHLSEKDFFVRKVHRALRRQ